MNHEAHEDHQAIDECTEEAAQQVVDAGMIVEVKAVDQLSSVHKARILTI